MGGVFYGHPETGFKTGNAPIAAQSARRFMAERSGNIVAVRHENRTMETYNITDRCTDKAPTSVWCKCKNGGLDKYTCGYTLSNSYSIGNGGSIYVEVREDDGSDDHLPSDVVLGRTAQPYVPMETGKYPELALENPVALQAGKLYHLVYVNVNTPQGCNRSGVSVSAAASCPRNQGMVGLNGTTHYIEEGPTSRYGPFLSRSPAVHYRQSSGNAWRISDTVTSWYEVKYDDDVWFGDSMVAYDSFLGAVDKKIEGSTRARQVFTVTDASRTVDGIWVNHGHTDYANGRSMQVQLKSANGSVLAEGEIPHSALCLQIMNNGDDAWNSGCKTWGYAEFPSAVELVEGSSYTLELNSPSGAGFRVTSYFTLSHYGSTDSTQWTDAYAESSTNSGASWSSWTENWTERDLPILFTIEGQPREIR